VPGCLPQFAGAPIRVEIRPSLGAHLAAASISRRIILMDAEVLRNRGDFERILIHEIFHFAWRRLSNTTRRSWESLLESEHALKASGELGWSAEWRKLTVEPADRRQRTARWRRYACESFCDSAAWLFSAVPVHDEFTLPARYRRRRKAWFARSFAATAAIPI
jgi:hypothetical protein